MKALHVSLALLLAGTTSLSAQDKKTPPGEKRIVTFSSLEALDVSAAKTQAKAWLKEAGKTDAATNAKFDAVWAQENTSLLERVAQTLVLGDANAAQMMRDIRDPAIPAPTVIPEFFKDASKSAFLRNNLAVAYARALSQRKVHEEALEVLKLVKAEQVIDPASYLFYRSLTEHALLQKAEASKTIFRLIEDVNGSPERYKTVAALMLLDMQTWKEKDLSAIGRKMNVIKDRLEIARGGPKTQKLQKEVVLRLDEIIKELENKSKGGGGGGGGGGQGDPNGGGCPSGGESPGSGPAGGMNPSAPAADSGIPPGQSTGKVDPVAYKKLHEQWNTLPPKAKEEALQKLSQHLPPRQREAVENFFRNLATPIIRK